jgi:hypothetical protein
MDEDETRMERTIVACLMFASLLLLAFPNMVAAQSSPSTYTIQTTLLDQAQQNTIAFDAFAFVTGNACSDTFLPPGELGDFFGFQYHRDNDQSVLGHSGEYLTGAANNVLLILSANQKTQLVTLAANQVDSINQYALNRFPLIEAINRQLQGDLPAGSQGLDKSAVMTYSASSAMYGLDADLTLQRAKVYAEILNSLSPTQIAYLNQMAAEGSASWPQVTNQLSQMNLSNDENVAVMGYAADIFSWYTGSVTADTYFSPEREAAYFGGFYLKDAPTMGNPSYVISTNLTGGSGQAFLAVLTASQSQLITSLVNTQRTDLNTIVQTRQTIATQLRTLLTGGSVNQQTVTSLMETYGQLDGEMSYYYATHFTQLYATLSSTQKTQLAAMRQKLNNITCSGAYLYAQNIAMPTIENTDFLFGGASTTSITVSSVPAGANLVSADGSSITTPQTFNTYALRRVIDFLRQWLPLQLLKLV